MKPTCSPFAPGRRKHVFGLAIVFSLVGCVCVPARAADDDAAGAQARLGRFQALRKERPNDGVLIFYEAIARLGLGQRETAFALLRSLKGRKLGLIPARGIGFDEVWDEPEFAAIRKELADEEPRTPDSPVAFRLNDPKLIPEGIAWDPKGERFFVGSIARRKIVVADVKGKARDFSGPNDTLDDILGLTIDGGGAHLYAVSTNGFEESAKTERRNAVVRYDLKSGHLLDRFAAPKRCSSTTWRSRTTGRFTRPIPPAAPCFARNPLKRRSTDLVKKALCLARTESHSHPTAHCT